MSKSAYVKLDAFDTMFLHGLLHDAAVRCGIDRVMHAEDHQLPPDVARARNLMFKIERAAMFTNKKQVVGVPILLPLFVT